jgi:hypothetical protein
LENELRFSLAKGGHNMPRGAGGGPKTPEGKARSSKNATKHGLTSPHPFIIEGLESPEEWEEFKLGYIQDLQAEGVPQTELAVNIAWGHWKLRRARLYENAIVSEQVDDEVPSPDDDEEDEDGYDDEEIDPEVLIRNQHARLLPGLGMDRLLRYQSQVRKDISQDTHSLEILQARRRGEPMPIKRVLVTTGHSFTRSSNILNDMPDLVAASKRIGMAEDIHTMRRRAARAHDN